ncbi:MAG: class I SAM-dependent methyltransferase, partial [bacterium]
MNNIISSKRIEFMGPPAAGKTYLYNVLCNIIKNNRYKSMHCYDEFLNIVKKNRTRKNIVYPRINEFIQLCIKSLSNSYSDPARNLKRLTWLHDSLELSKDIEKIDSKRCIILDESLCQRGHSVCLTSKDFNLNVIDYFKIMPKPFAIINVHCEYNIIKNRLLKRNTENITEELSHIEKSISLFKAAREILLNRGVIILDLDSNMSLNDLTLKMDSFLSNIVNYLYNKGDEDNTYVPLDKRYFGNNALQYEKKRTSDEQWHQEDKAVENFIKTVCPENLLDVPIGTGRFLPLYEKYKIKITGVDISSDMLISAKSKSKQLSYPISTQIGDIFSLPFSKDSFDCVLCLRFLNWIAEEDMFKVLKQFREISKKHIIISLRTKEDTNTAIMLENNLYIHSKKLFYRFLKSLRLGVEDEVFINNRYGGFFSIYLI